MIMRQGVCCILPGCSAKVARAALHINDRMPRAESQESSFDSLSPLCSPPSQNAPEQKSPREEPAPSERRWRRGGLAREGGAQGAKERHLRSLQSVTSLVTSMSTSTDEERVCEPLWAVVQHHKPTSYWITI